MRIVSSLNIAALLFIITVYCLMREPEPKVEVVDPIKESLEQSETVNSEYGYVDLGLSVKWATMDLGTTDIVMRGKYYSWSEIDAPSKEWGREWRTPTASEMQELLDRCKWEQIVRTNKRGKPISTSFNSFIGYKVTGPNGNHIIIPYLDGSEDYWTSTNKRYIAFIPNTEYSGDIKIGESPNISIMDKNKVGWYDSAKIRPVRD